MKMLTTITLLTGFFSFGSALMCYVCNSYNDTNCLTPEAVHSTVFLRDCGNNNEGKEYKLCRKIEMHLDMEFGNRTAETRIHRACGYIDDTKEVDNCYYKSGYNTRSWVCSCYSDSCNGAPNSFEISLSKIVLLALVSIAFVSCCY